MVEFHVEPDGSRALVGLGRGAWEKTSSMRRTPSPMSLSIDDRYSSLYRGAAVPGHDDEEKDDQARAMFRGSRLSNNTPTGQDEGQERGQDGLKEEKAGSRSCQSNSWSVSVGHHVLVEPCGTTARSARTPCTAGMPRTYGWPTALTVPSVVIARIWRRPFAGNSREAWTRKPRTMEASRRRSSRG